MRAHGQDVREAQPGTRAGCRSAGCSRPRRRRGTLRRVTAIIRSRSGFRTSEPRLRFTTPGPWWIAALRPRMTSPAVIPMPGGSRPRGRGSPGDRRPRLPRPFIGAAATDATAVPCSSSCPDVLCRFSGVVNGRPANSSCVRSTPVSMIVSGFPGPGGTAPFARTNGIHQSVPSGGHVQRRERLVGRDLGDEVVAKQSRKHVQGGARGHAPDRKRRRELLAARFPERGPGSGLREDEPGLVRLELARESTSRERRGRHGAERENGKHDDDPETLQGGEHSTSVQICLRRYRLQSGRS